MFKNKTLWSMAAALLSLSLVADSALACGGWDGGASVRVALPVAVRPQGKPVKSSELVAAAHGDGDEAMVAAALARSIVRAGGHNTKISRIDGKRAIFARQLDLARELLEVLAAREPDNARIATDLGEVLTLSPHQADRIRGLNLLAKLDARGTLTTAQGYRALASVWSEIGDSPAAHAALQQCNVLATSAGQCMSAQSIAQTRLSAQPNAA